MAPAAASPFVDPFAPQLSAAPLAPVTGGGCYVLGCRGSWHSTAVHVRFGRVRCCHDHGAARGGPMFAILATVARPGPDVDAARAYLAELAGGAPAGPASPTPDSDRPNEGSMAPVRPSPIWRPPGGSLRPVPVGGGDDIPF